MSSQRPNFLSSSPAFPAVSPAVSCGSPAETLHSTCSKLKSPPYPPTFFSQKRGSSTCFADVFRFPLLFITLTQFIIKCCVFESIALTCLLLSIFMLGPYYLSDDIAETSSVVFLTPLISFTQSPVLSF